MLPHKLFWTDNQLGAVRDDQVENLCRSFANISSANIKLPKTQISRII